jgi:hypothetical protein
LRPAPAHPPARPPARPPGPNPQPSPCRQYLLTAYLLGGAGLVYLAIKASLLSYAEGRLPTAVLLSTFGLFSILHIYAARCADLT